MEQAEPLEPLEPMEPTEPREPTEPMDAAERPEPPGDDDEGAEEAEEEGEEEAEVPAGESILVGPGGMDDPETAWQSGEPEEPLPGLAPGEFLLLEPGEDPLIVERLPKPRHFRFGVAFSLGEVVVCVGRRRTWSRTPVGRTSDHADVPLAHRLVIVFVQHRARGNTNKPLRYLVVAGTNDELLGWFDYSNTWSFDAQALKHAAESVGLLYEVERFTTEAEFDRAHGGWVSDR